MKLKRKQPLSARLRASVSAGLAAAAVLLCGNVAQAQPTITAVSPDGTHLFQPSSTLSFTASSPVGVTNVTVSLTVSTLTGLAYLQNLSLTSGLTVVGPSTAETVSAVLRSNTQYSASIQVIDGTGATVSTNISFDTIAPILTFEAEDFDYNSGQFFDNPQTNKYRALTATLGVDANHSPTAGGAAYRPNPLSTESNGDRPRLAYMGAGNTNQDYDVGFNNGGDWGNYTRTIPAGLYNVYGRLADGNGSQNDCASLTVQSSVSGNVSLAGNGPFQFSVKSTGWQTYNFYPLTDANGAYAQLSSDGSVATLRVTVDGGNFNANFYMLVPADTNVPVQSVTFTNFYPDGTVQFQPASALTFTLLTPAPGIDPGGILVNLAGTNLTGQGYAKSYTTANGLTTTGTPTNLNVSIPLTNGYTYSAFLQVIDSAGTPNSAQLVFDTINPTYTFDAEDFDYNSGQFFDNPQTNAYSGQSGVPEIDYHVDNPFSGSHNYRNYDPFVGGPSTEAASDIPRIAYYTNGVPDYDIGFNDPANWENYTRNYPTGTFNIFMRASDGGGGAGSAAMALVTSGQGTSSQTVSNLGTFTVPATGNWQKYEWVPLKDSSGNLVAVPFSGGNPETLRVVGPSSCNAQFYLLQPASQAGIIVSGLYPDGSFLLQKTNTLSFTASSLGGIATNTVILTLNGSPVQLTFTGTSTSRRATYSGLKPNTSYSATLTIQSIAGGSYNHSWTFDTFSPDNYQWEASDYDYTSNGVSGLFFDNPQVDKYAGLDAAIGIDELEVTSGTPVSEDLYRPSPDGVTALITTQGGGDAPRVQFGTNAIWRINWFGFGDFANYTRHYPAGQYNVVAKFTEGGAASSATLYKVTAGAGTTNQTTSLLGSFQIPLSGWNGWTYQWLTDSSTNLVTVTLDGTQTTLQLGGPLADDGQTINVGFFMLIPVVTPHISAAISGGNVVISFPTASGHTYQVLYKNLLTDATWTSLPGGSVSGDGSVKSASDPATRSFRFYRVQVQ